MVVMCKLVGTFDIINVFISHFQICAHIKIKNTQITNQQSFPLFVYFSKWEKKNLIEAMKKTIDWLIVVICNKQRNTNISHLQKLHILLVSTRLFLWTRTDDRYLFEQLQFNPWRIFFFWNKLFVITAPHVWGYF